LLLPTLYFTEPLPVPLAPEVTLIQESLDTAVHAQPASAVTDTVPLPPLALNESLVGEMEYVQAEAAGACETVKVCPATVIVPVRALPVFAAAVKATVPLPVPLWPLVNVIHDALDVAVHAQPPFAVTDTLPEPPVAGTDCDVGEIEYVHDNAASVTVNV
jgi:hypothetical protein